LFDPIQFKVCQVLLKHTKIDKQKPHHQFNNIASPFSLQSAVKKPSLRQNHLQNPSAYMKISFSKKRVNLKRLQNLVPALGT